MFQTPRAVDKVKELMKQRPDMVEIFFLDSYKINILSISLYYIYILYHSVVSIQFSFQLVIFDYFSNIFSLL